MIKSSYILLRNMRFYAYHGVGAQENRVGNEYMVNLRLKTDISQAMRTDEVGDTIDYAEVWQSVKQEMDIPSRLLEHVCGRIVSRLMNDFPTVSEVEIRLEKRNPPMGADVDTAGVEMVAAR